MFRSDLSSSLQKTAAVLGLALGCTALALPAFAGGDVDYGNGIIRRGTYSAIPVPAPVPVPDIASGYYLRLDAAYSVNSIDRYRDSDPHLDGLRNDDGLQNFGRYGLGAGYYFSRYIRGDVTIDVRNEVRSKTTGTIDYSGPIDATGTGHAILMRDSVFDRMRTKNYTGLINAYVDIPVTSAFTPYVGAGFGLVMHTTPGRTVQKDTKCVDTLNCDPRATGPAPQPLFPNDPNYTGLNATTSNAAASRRSTDLAWAVMAGASYQVAHSMKLDIGYRMLSLGGTNFTTPWHSNTPAVLTIPDQINHEFRVGVRYDVN